MTNHSIRNLNVIQWIVERRGTVVHEESLCVYCGLCANGCPMEAISVSRKDRSLKVDPRLCVRCCKCVKACPKGALHLESGKQSERYGSFGFDQRRIYPDSKSAVTFPQ